MASIIKCFWELLLVLSFFSVTSYSENEKIDWESLMPDTCVSNLSFSLPTTPIQLNVSVRVKRIADISEEKMEFGMQIDLVLFWNDPSLKIFNTDSRLEVKSASLIPQRIVDCIWKPDVIFTNAKSVDLLRQPTVNTFYKLILPSGFIVKTSRYQVVLACPMKFDYYPMDSQKCSIQISLYNSRSNDVTLRWSKNLNALKVDETPLNYAIRPLNFTKTYYEYKKNWSGVEVLNANYVFERSLSASLFNIYIPSFLVVCLSMVSFWLDVEAVPGRVTLGVTAILTLSTQIVQARSGLPTLDYMTAMDIWLLGCLLMVFLSLIEFTLANSFARKIKYSEKVVLLGEESMPRGFVTWAKTATKKRSPKKVPRGKSGAAKKFFIKYLKPLKINVSHDNLLDRVSRIFFPLVNLFFGSLYWGYYYNKAYP